MHKDAVYHKAVSYCQNLLLTMHANGRSILYCTAVTYSKNVFLTIQMGKVYITAVSHSQNLNLTMHEGGRSILLLYSSQLLLESPRHHVCKEVEVYHSSRLLPKSPHNVEGRSML